MAGAKPQFTDLDVIRCFLSLSVRRSRATICGEIGLGEGVVRTILDGLKEKKYLTSTNHGHILNRKGLDLFDDYISRYSMPAPSSLARLGDYQSGVVVKVKGVDNIVKARDNAVRAGASGALIFTYDGTLRLPPIRAGKEYKDLTRQFMLQPGYRLVICYAEDKRSAENGSIAAALELGGNFKL